MMDLAPYIKQALESSGFEVRLASYRFREAVCDAFLSIQCGRSTDLASGGAFVVYPRPEAGRLARRIAAAYEARWPFEFSGVNAYPKLKTFDYFRNVSSPAMAALQLGYITNPRERRWLRQNRKTVAIAIREGFERFFLTSTTI